jgi:hypothetical protein
MAAISLAPNGLLKILGLAGRLAGKEASKEPDGVEARLSAGADSRHPSLAEMLAVRLASGG